ncbi:hypothetical protein HUA74_18710 [Myxococcus sp. CA051A]|uniref:hypothetical protein n=1 Tax=unclassified Myxococcus TaxID=2648731 RepID=UPI00157AC307|nr:MULTISPECIES: hypothetical protein [unclassified Myxococcus]NTX01926.1 hypothetical protein [Myxococcus sp. CA040A]NTX38754.1 hypothetical protein [Myxococcus sp. CA033]NTX54522.1 hypothetical protein [Myxococcus sp. CA039A]NTX62681.1 hypothetical protein [Myxococcus sp. CA051A]
MTRWLVPVLVLVGAAMMTALGHLSFNAALFVPLLALGGGLLLLVTLVLAVLPARRSVNFVTLAYLLGGVALAGAGMVRGMSWRFDRVEEEFAPLIAALDAYHAEKGQYPEAVAELIPAHLSKAPSCELESEPAVRQGLSDGGYYRKGPDDYGITCYTIVFWKYSYNPVKKYWYGWD